MQEQNTIPKTQANPWLFFILAFVLSWLFWVPAAVLSQSDPPFPLGILFLLGGFGPSISGVVMVYWTQNKTARYDFWQRVFGFRRIGRVWYAFTLLVFPVIAALGVSAEVLAGRSPPFFPYLAALAAEPVLVLWLPVIALQVALLGPLSEELGWRGYAIDALQAKWSALVSSLVVGIFWSVWHGPLFFIRDGSNFYYEWGFGTRLFWFSSCG
jgi:membrane protease YdiL (CAAX protease family)